MFMQCTLQFTMCLFLHMSSFFVKIYIHEIEKSVIWLLLDIHMLKYLSYSHSHVQDMYANNLCWPFDSLDGNKATLITSKFNPTQNISLLNVNGRFIFFVRVTTGKGFMMDTNPSLKRDIRLFVGNIPQGSCVEDKNNIASDMLLRSKGTYVKVMSRSFCKWLTNIIW